jgi:hypothetical protein
MVQYFRFRSFLEVCLAVKVFEIFPRDQIDDFLRRVRSGEEFPAMDQVQKEEEVYVVAVSIQCDPENATSANHGDGQRVETVAAQRSEIVEGASNRGPTAQSTEGAEDSNGHEGHDEPVVQEHPSDPQPEQLVAVDIQGHLPDNEWAPEHDAPLAGAPHWMDDSLSIEDFEYSASEHEDDSGIDMQITVFPST